MTVKFMGVQTVDTPYYKHPVYKDYDVLLGDDPALTLWLSQFDTRTVVTDTYVVSGVDRAHDVAYAGGPSPRGPSLAESALLKQKVGLYFPNAGERKYIDIPAALPWSSHFSFATLLDLDTATDAVRTVFKSTNAGNPAFYLTVISSSGNQRLDAAVVDAAGVSPRCTTPVGSIPNTGVLPIIGSWNATTETLYLTKDTGYNWTPSTVFPLFEAPTGAADIRIGATSSTLQSVKARVMDFQIWTGAALREAANAARLQTIRDFWRDAFGYSAI